MESTTPPYDLPAEMRTLLGFINGREDADNPLPSILCQETMETIELLLNTDRILIGA